MILTELFGKTKANFTSSWVEDKSKNQLLLIAKGKVEENMQLYVKKVNSGYGLFGRDSLPIYKDSLPAFKSYIKGKNYPELSPQNEKFLTSLDVNLVDDHGSYLRLSQSDLQEAAKITEKFSSEVEYKAQINKLLQRIAAGTRDWKGPDVYNRLSSSSKKFLKTLK